MAIEITGNKAEVTVGEKIALEVKITKNWGVLKSVEWTIPGTYVKNYTDNASKAQVKKLTDADRKKIKIAFYWVDGGDGRVVEAKCVYTSKGKNVNKTLSVTCDVKAPTLDQLNFTTTSVNLVPSGTPYRMAFTTGPGITGIKWDWKVTVPSVRDGWVKDMQTVQTTREWKTITGLEQFFINGKKKSPPSDVLLDTDNPYSLPGDFHATLGFPLRVSAGGSHQDNYTSDTPGHGLNGIDTLTIHDDFVYYVMYKPDVAHAIWVPVGKAAWFWAGVAELQSGVWSLVSASNQPSGSGTATTDFPEYKDNVRNVKTKTKPKAKTP